MKISIIIPVYNEESTIADVIKKVHEAPFGVSANREIIVVNDGSHDKTSEILSRVPDIQLITLEENQGKGRAVAKGFQVASGDIVLIQDADLEYDVKDYPRLLKPLLDKHADVVFGNRFHGEEHTVIYFRNYIGNKFLTFLSNLLTGLNLGDIECGYKVFRREVVASFEHKLQSKRFGIEPELVACVAQGKWRVCEVPVNYYGRRYDEGKKIKTWDGIKAIFAIIYFRFLNCAKQR